MSKGTSMSRTKPGLGFLAFFGLLFMMIVPAFAAITTTHIATDAEMEALIKERVAIAEGRIGSNSIGGATFELDLGADTAAPAVTEEFVWPNGVAQPFLITYDKLSNTMHFIVGTEDLVYQPTEEFTDIFVRARAVNAETSEVVHQLTFNGQAINDTADATNPPDNLDILWIRGADLDDSFAFSGKSTMTWAGTAPTQSKLAFQIKFVTLKEPEICIKKEIEPCEYAMVGDTVVYKYTIENTGCFPLKDITVCDSVFGDLTPLFKAVNYGSDCLDPGEVRIFTVPFKVVCDTPAEICNKVDVVGFDELCRKACAFDEATLKVIKASICIDKTADRCTADVGDVIKYTITIKNTGNVPLENIVVDDTLLGDDLAGFDTIPLCPNECRTAYFYYTVTEEDAEAGSVINKVTVTSNPEYLPNKCITACDEVTVTINSSPPPVDGAILPDAIIRNAGSSSPCGKDIYNSTCASQTTIQSIYRGSSATYQPRIENDGNCTDTLIVKGTAGGNGWTVRYYNAMNGGTDITSQVTGSGWVVGPLSPNGARDFKIVVTATSSCTGTYKDVIMTVSSKTNSSKCDSVKAVTKIK